jgi:hypothetical protein
VVCTCTLCGTVSTRGGSARAGKGQGQRTTAPDKRPSNPPKAAPSHKRPGGDARSGPSSEALKAEEPPEEDFIPLSVHRAPPAGKRTLAPPPPPLRPLDAKPRKRAKKGGKLPGDSEPSAPGQGQGQGKQPAPGSSIKALQGLFSSSSGKRPANR